MNLHLEHEEIKLFIDDIYQELLSMGEVPVGEYAATHQALLGKLNKEIESLLEEEKKATVEGFFDFSNYETVVLDHEKVVEGHASNINMYRKAIDYEQELIDRIKKYIEPYAKIRNRRI